MKKVFVRALTLLLAVSMLFMSACGDNEDDGKISGRRTTAAITVNSSVETTTTSTGVTMGTSGTDASSATALSTVTTGEGTSTMQPGTSVTKPIVTKPSTTGTTAVVPADPTSGFVVEFESWLENLIGYEISAPKRTTTSDETILAYTFTGADTADYCVHIHSGKDESIRAVYVSVEAMDYDVRFSVISYYVYASLGLNKMDSDAFLGQFDAFPDAIELQNKAEGEYHMSCVKPDEFLTFAVVDKSVSSFTAEKVGKQMQGVPCGCCYDDENRALNYMVLTDNAEDLGIDGVMLERALVSQGNRVRLANVMRRAQNGEEITIGYIGGSVTEGAYASDYNKTSYAGLSFAWWEKTFPKATFNFVKAGCGGTSSLFGVHRVQEDLLKYDPDFVIVEFGVNDCSHSFQTEAYANLIHRILTYSSQPAVMQVYVMNSDGGNVQDIQTTIGKHYGLPQISYRDSVYPEVKSGNLQWEEIAADWVHPNDYGHSMIAELIVCYLTKTYQDLAVIGTQAPAAAKPYLPYVYESAAYLNKNNLTPLSMNGFKTTGNKNASWYTPGEGSITFEFTGKRCVLAIPASYYNEGVNASIRIDGGEALSLAGPVFSGGAFANIIVLDTDTTAKHIIEIICNSGSMYISGLFVS